MDPYRTEEDQIKAIREWWGRNGSSTLISVGLALAIVFGWQWWQQRTLSSAEEAAALYQQLLQAAERASGDAVQQTTALHLAEQLRDQQGGNRYGDYASLLLARMLVEKDDLAGAEKELRGMLERHPDVQAGPLMRWVNARLGRDIDPQLGALARLRLARVLFALDRAPEALEVLDGGSGQDFSIENHELRGDILLATGDAKGAQDAYRMAVELARARGGVRLLELKLREAELGVPPAPAAPAGGSGSPAAEPVAVEPVAAEPAAPSEQGDTP